MVRSHSLYPVELRGLQGHSTAENLVQCVCQFRHSDAFVLRRGNFPAILIFRRPLNVIDDENLHGPLLRFQLEPKLLLNRGEDRGARRIGRGRVISPLSDVRIFKHRSSAPIWCPPEREIVAAR